VAPEVPVAPSDPDAPDLPAVPETPGAPGAPSRPPTWHPTLKTETNVTKKINRFILLFLL
jgi:hypothetical protein